MRRVPAALRASASPIPGIHRLSEGSRGIRGHIELDEGGCQGNMPSASVLGGSAGSREAVGCRGLGPHLRRPFCRCGWSPALVRLWGRRWAGQVWN